MRTGPSGPSSSEHQTIWGTSGLLGTLNLLKSLTWPSTLPVIALPSAFFGSQQVDFNQWAWFFTVLRTLVIATASIAAYRIIFVGEARQAHDGDSDPDLLLAAGVLLLLTDWGLGIWDSLLSVADSTLATIGTAGLTLPVIPDQYAWVLGATGMSQALAILASAMGTRFLLQTIPFVRWGS
jgi:hypothetical protein